MSADNRETIASVILLHKQKKFRSIFELSSISLNDSNLKKSYHELVRRVHPDKNGTNPDSTLAQQNLADAYAFLQREREKEIEIERENERENEKKNERERVRNKIRFEQREEKRKRENKFNIKREKERRERYEVRDSSTSESYSDDSSIGSLLLKGFAKRQHQKNAAMEEKRKKEKRKNFAAKKNELEILAKKLVSMRKRSKGSDWYRGGKIVSGEDMETQRRVCQKIK